MNLKNQTYSKLVVASIIVLIGIHSIGLALSIHDLFYLRKILLGKILKEGKHAFFLKKNVIEYWVVTIACIVYLILFLTWFYRVYKNVYSKEFDRDRRAIFWIATINNGHRLLLPDNYKDVIIESLQYFRGTIKFLLKVFYEGCDNCLAKATN